MSEEENPEKIQLPPHRDCYVCGEEGDNRMNISSYWNSVEKVFTMEVFFGPKCQGPPGYAHGGSTAALLDETMGGSAWLNGYPVIAANLNFDLINMIPLNKKFTATGRVKKKEGRKVYATAELKDENGQICAKSKGLFLVMKNIDDHFLKLAGSSGPAEAWIKYEKERKGKNA
jgi:acyl-coenzyme A thioesterase PaaI-like protein